MKELSIFIDESGDFGEYESHSPYYIISMVMHDQTVDISEDLDKLEQQMFHIGWPKHCIHAGPVIRSEYEYKDYDLDSKMLASVFSVLLDNVEFKKVIPSDYRLFQVADLVCTLKLAELKMDRHTLSKSERLFFKDDRTLRKNYLKIIKSKEL